MSEMSKIKEIKGTRKKVKVIGTKEYINKETGEIEEMNVVSVEERDANFHKLWLGNILNHIDLIGNQKAKLAFWILDNLNSENQLIATQRKISEETDISIRTVNETLKILMNSNFLVRINAGAYCVNPNIIFKGGKDDRLNVLIKYQNERKGQKYDINKKRD